MVESTYISLFIDVVTRYSSVKIIKRKSGKNILAHFNEFVAFIERQSDNKVTRLVTDN